MNKFEYVGGGGPGPGSRPCMVRGRGCDWGSPSEHVRKGSGSGHSVKRQND